MVRKSGCSVLSPAGSMDVLDACIFSGADCVYLSGKKFGARAFAGNFSDDELVEAVSFAHKYNVRVFVTVNTSILECEIVDVVDYVFFLYSHGVDAVIIQDIGLGYILKDVIPDLEIHASTQMTIHDSSFIKWLACNGYGSVNISREVSLDSIKSIRDELSRGCYDVDVECFVHGAVCYSYSGRCLMSSFMGGRSGNRGLCAQPCRMKYSLVVGDNCISGSNYLLSTKDLCTYKGIDLIKKAGVSTLKIEGRMKSREYVSAVTYVYRRAVDGRLSYDDFILLNLAFNRGLTGGYLLGGDGGDVVSRVRSGSQGFPVGRVVKVSGNRVTVRFGNTRYPARIVNGDGIKFEDNGGGCGMYVSGIISQSRKKITLKFNKRIDVKEGAFVYITYSKYLEDKTRAIIHEKHVHKINLDLELTVDNQMYLRVKCRCDALDEDVLFKSSTRFSKAKTKPLTKQRLNQQLHKTGNTQFIIKNITYTNFKNSLFMSITDMNNIRRELLSLIERKINETYMPCAEDIEASGRKIGEFKAGHRGRKYDKSPEDDQEYVLYISNIGQLEYVTKEYHFIDYIYYDSSFNFESMEEYFDSILLELVAVWELTDKPVVWKLPALTGEEYVDDISYILDKLDDMEIEVKLQTDNIGIAGCVNGEFYGCDLNVYNNYTIEKLAEDPNFTTLEVSGELSYDQIRDLHPYNGCCLEYPLFKTTTLMITKDNFKNMMDENQEEKYYLVDDKNNRYPVIRDCNNNTHILNNKTTDLTGHIEQLQNTQIKKLAIDIRGYSRNLTKSVMKYIRRKLSYQKAEKPEKMELYEGNFKKGVYREKQ